MRGILLIRNSIEIGKTPSPIANGRKKLCNVPRRNIRIPKSQSGTMQWFSIPLALVGLEIFPFSMEMSTN